jgi:hypothetical protein
MGIFATMTLDVLVSIGTYTFLFIDLKLPYPQIRMG